MELIYSLIFSLLPILSPPAVVEATPHYGPSSSIFKYNLLFNQNKQLIRYANRFEQAKAGTYIRNTHITPKDLDRIVQIINQKDVLRGGLNERRSVGVGSTGVKFKKRAQELMYDLDPNTPTSENIKKNNVSNATKGYSTKAHLSFKGLMVGDTVTLLYNKGQGTKNIYESFVITSEHLGNSGTAQFDINMGVDTRTSSGIGVQVAFGTSESTSRFDSGTLSYSIEIERTVEIRKPPSSAPIRKGRVKKRG